MFRILVLLLLIILTQTDAFGQAYRFFNVNAGLSSSRINAVQQDYEGYIWIATEDGLNRFDEVVSTPIEIYQTTALRFQIIM